MIFSLTSAHEGRVVLPESEDAHIEVPVAKDDALAELERLLSDPNFQASERNKSFLRYVVVEFLEGRSESIKAYSIAVDVFGRSPTFDPSTDPIVRIEATRLRAALAHCYETHSSRVRIDLPKGRYVPRFVRADVPLTNAALPPEASPVDRENLAGHLSLHAIQKAVVRVRWTVTVSVIALAGIGIFSYYYAWSQKDLFPRFSEKPLVSIELEETQNWTNEDGSRLHGELLAALSRFQSLRLADTTDLGKVASVHATPTIVPISRTYRAVLKLETTGDQQIVWWRILNDMNEVVQTGKQTAIVSTDDPSMEFEALVSRLSRDIAGYRGAIPVIETRLELDNPTLGNGCVQRVLVALGERLEEEIRKGRECLEQTLAVQPGNADARAALSLIILTAKPFETTAEEKARALELARTAVSLAPESHRSAFALTIALYHAREVDAAIASGYRAMLLNPNEYGQRVYLGWILFASRQWEEGVRFVEESRGKTPTFQNFDSGATLLLDAYRRGDYEKVIRMLGERPYRRPYLAALIHIATLGQLGQEKEAASVIEALRKVRPGFDNSFLEDMAARSLAPELVSGLKTGLVKAGLQIR